MTTDTAQASRRLPQGELIAMLAFLFATVAFSMDAMLPALPEIAAQLTPDDVNRAQLILTSFMAGMGLGTLFAGPVSDAIGRKPAMAIGFAVYLVASAVALFVNSLELLLAARFAQGLGAAAPRIVGTALVRDLYSGREMARITSFIMMVFMIVPALAPLIGVGFIHLMGWHGVFVGFILFGAIGWLWLSLRQPETLPPVARRPLQVGTLWTGVREVLSDRQVVLSTITISLGFGQMFALLSSAQQLFGETYDKGGQFPLWFAAMAILAGTGTLINSRLVMRIGMRRIARGAYAVQIWVSALFLLLLVTDVLPEGLRFPVFFLWAVGLFMMAGLTFGNLNAMAMQRMGHIAGLTASVVSAISTLGAVAIAAPVGLAYDGTAIPVALAAVICSTLAWLIMGRMK
ncbi:multidrug effflux MFS transporter [Paracoccus chinensis]|uniref:Bcr/CflA family efflux transporter n=1 Tax=Paracoccus chinensis TaxID=525640 RepID=A0A1G9M0Y5_9RHOB|nr:multidrug effflux MFS transporter [Paracoccus chinensis]SDL67631.1 MFS transporter, DHA1 family, bicyclomycin/chloramphenicol resistance protein [Paracoccus chinensis]